MNNEILKKIEENTKYINEFKLETTKGTKKVIEEFKRDAQNKRNEFVNKEIDKFSKLKSEFYNELKERYTNNYPKDYSFEKEKLIDKVNEFTEIIKFNDPSMDTPTKLGLTTIENDLLDYEANNLMMINQLLKKAISIFRRASINVNKHDFDYSMFTYVYMTKFFKVENEENFDVLMKDLFESIYWECPDITMHLKLCIKSICTKYQKELDKYVLKVNKTFFDDLVTLDNYMNLYAGYTDALKKYNETDDKVITDLFVNDTLKISDFLEDAKYRKDLLNKYLVNTDFGMLDANGKVEFFKNIFELKNMLEEYTSYIKYKNLIDDLLKRYKTKESYKGKLKEKMTEISKEEANRSKILKVYLNNAGKSFFKKIDIEKQKQAKIDINQSIKKLDQLYKDLEDDKLNDEISKLTDTKSIRDLLLIATRNYKYAKDMLTVKDGDKVVNNPKEEVNDLFSYVYNAKNQFINTINLTNEEDVSSLIVKKCNLLNIKVNKEALAEPNNLLTDINNIVLIETIDNSNISFDLINELVEISKLS